MNDLLKTLYEAKRIATIADKRREPLDEIIQRGLERISERRSLYHALRNAVGFGLIAEVKHASPSLGNISANFDPVAIAAVYEQAKVDAISVLTEESQFLGDIHYLDVVRRNTSRPILRKDFLTDPYEIAQAGAYGADAVLLIVAGLSDEQLRLLLAEAERFALDALVEVHDAFELQRAISAGANIIGINNRNLRDFSVDLAVTEKLAPDVPSEIVLVSESGIHDPADLMRVVQAGAGAVLIGEALMRASDPAALVSQMRRTQATLRR